MNGHNHAVPSTEMESNVQEDKFDENKLLTLLQQLETQTPSIPDKVLEEIMSSKGMRSDDVRITRLVALAGQKFLSDILDDVWRLNKLKGSAQNSRSSKNKDKKATLTTEDIKSALGQRSIQVNKPPYYV